ncbi:MAG TPA: hypothetical protein G4O01_03670 [Dehalococcoidia bacterium]|jgi:hypothetical protein|nr:hypothetical protein [Dehalococcoidia bacterium]
MMKGVGKTTLSVLTVALSPLMILAWPLLIGAGAGVSLFRGWKRPDVNRVCSVDADCPPGFVCVNGRCVPERA